MAEKAKAENEYLCPKCRKMIRTVNRDSGTTPFMLKCRATEGCDGFSQSNFYRKTSNETPKYEWIAPTPEEFDQWIVDESAEQHRDSLADHVRNGGMLLRKLK
jgi:hypothetical protein